jgi:hypothetical protein
MPWSKRRKVLRDTSSGNNKTPTDEKLLIDGIRGLLYNATEVFAEELTRLSDLWIQLYAY